MNVWSPDFSSFHHVFIIITFKNWDMLDDFLANLRTRTLFPSSSQTSGLLQSAWVRKVSEAKRLMFNFFAFPVYCSLLLLVLFLFYLFLLIVESYTCIHGTLSLFVFPVCILQDYSEQAAVNVKFLSLLKEPCEELERLKPSEVAPKMKRIISLIYTIWANNQHYSSNEKISDLVLMVAAFVSF